jgi:hypothetical protein
MEKEEERKQETIRGRKEREDGQADRKGKT